VTESLLATFQQWLLFSGAVLAIGCVAWRSIVAAGARRAIGSSAEAAIAGMERTVAALGVGSSLVVAAAWMLRMVVQVMGFRDPFVPLWEDVSFLLFETTWGTVWMAQGVTLPFLIGAFAWARSGSTRAWRMAVFPVLALVATLALASHAMGVESARALFVTVDGVHALAAGCWIGALAIIVTVGRPAEGDEVGRRLFAAQLRAFSPMAVASVAALIAMGTALSWTHLGSLSNLWATGYGRVLMAKVSVAGAVFLAGLINWEEHLFYDTMDGALAVHRRAALEVGLAAAVLLLTAVLVHSVKP